MKAILRNMGFVLICAAALQACTAEEAQPVSYKAPEVEFTMPSDAISAVVGQSVNFSARVVSGDKVSSAWYIDNVLVSGAQSFDYVFDEPGVYAVRFEARNGGGKVEHRYTVTVTDLLEIKLSVGDSTEVHRLEYGYLQVAAIVEHGAGVVHEWSVDGVVKGREAFFGSFFMPSAGSYTVDYKGYNEIGTYLKSFTVVADARPLQVGFSIDDEIIAMLAGRTLTITATPQFGGEGLTQTWYLDDEPAGTEAVFSHYFVSGGDFTLRYEGVNAKGETVTCSWMIAVTSTGRLFDDFEADTIGPWFKLGENQPGIERVKNPDKTGINDSDWCLRDMVYGSGGTSGYFTLQCPKMLSEAGFDVSEYTGIRFMAYIGNNQYYPRVEFGGTKYASTTAPKFGAWEVLEYRLPEGKTFDSTKNITFRLLLQENGSNISGGNYQNESNNRTVYIDNIEFFK